MPRSAASGLGLHGWPMSHKKDARLIWVKGIEQFIECLDVCNIRNILPIKQQNDILHQKQCLISPFILAYQ